MTSPRNATDGSSAASGAETGYRRLVEQMPVGIFRASMDGTLLEANDALARMFGFEDAASLIGTSAGDLYLDPGERPTAVRHMLQGEGPIELRLRRRDGAVIWGRLFGRPVAGADGRPEALEGVVTDITDRKEAERALAAAEERYRSLVEQVPAVIYVDEPGPARKVYMSPQIARMLGFTPEEWTADPGLWARQLHPDDRARMVGAYERARTAGAPFDAEYRLFSRDGRLVWVHDRASVVRNAAGRTIALQGVMQDVTERKRAEEALRDSEERYRSLVGALEEAILLFDAEGVVRACNPAVERVLGLRPEQVMGRSVTDEAWKTVREDGSELPPEAGPIATAIRTGIAQQATLGLRREDGDVVWLSMRAQPLPNAAVDPPTAVVASLADVTDRRRAEETIRRSEAHFRALIEHSWDMVLVVDGGGMIRYGSPSVERTLGHEPREYLGRNVFEFVHPDDREDAERSLMSALPQPGFMPARMLRVRNRRGAWRQIEVVPNNLLGEPSVRGVVLNARDVTEHVEAKGRIAAADERYRTLVEQIPVVTYTQATGVSAWGDGFYISPQIEGWLGYSVEEWHDPELWASLLHPDDRETVLRDDARTDATGEAFSIEYRLRARDGRWVWIRDEATLRTDPSGGRVWQGVLTNVTDRRLAEAALREAEAQYRELVEEIPVVTYEQVLDAEGRLERAYVSPQVEAWLGYPASECGGSEFWLTIVHPDDQPRIRTVYDRSAHDDEPYVEEYRVRARDGRWVWIREDAVLRDRASGHRHWRGVLTDVTERKQAEEARMQSLAELERVNGERRRLLASLVAAQEEERRRIAADIHDDSVQVMAAAAMRLQLLRRDAPREQLRAVDRLEQTVNESIRRLRHMMFELRPPALDREGLAAALREYLAEMGATADIDYRVESRLAAEPGQATRTIVYRIAQEALANVRKHARATMVEVTLESERDGIATRVRDDGVGLPADPEDARIAGHLGFTAMRERAEMAGGWWRAASPPGGGTLVEFWVPVEAEPPELDPDPDAEREGPWTGEAEAPATLPANGGVVPMETLR